MRGLDKLDQRGVGLDRRGLDRLDQRRVLDQRGLGRLDLRRRVGVVLAVVLVLAGCGSEPAPLPDAGTQAGAVAGFGAGLDAAGVTVISPGEPASADRDAVRRALQRAGVGGVAGGGSGEVDTGPLALDPDQGAGLLDVLGPAETGGADGYVVLLFDEPVSAAAYASADREVFANAGAERARVGFLSGVVLVYADPTDDPGLPGKVRSALRELAGSGGARG